MRTLGRRAAIGATALALLAAAAGTSLAAVRADRDESLVLSDTSRPAPGGRGSATSGTPRAATTPDGAAQPAPGAGAPAPPAPAGAAPPGAAASPAPGQADPAAGAGDPADSPARTPGQLVPGIDGSILDPVLAPRPPSGAGPPSATAACPADKASGALPVRRGPLEAVRFTLPWPGLVPVVVVPQASAQTPGPRARIVRSSVGGVATDGSNLTVVAPNPIEYTLGAGEETAVGSIQFAPLGPIEQVTHQACRDRRFALYDVGRKTLDGSPLRIVGVVGPPGMVTIDEDGGAARFTSSLPGVHTVTLLTATDAGTAGPLVTAVVTTL